jgi:glutathione reductase (NADPH)
MENSAFDVVVIGGGNAAIGVTGPARRAGLSVAMIESDKLGGTCPNRGCTPKKILVAAANCLDEIGRAHVHRVDVKGASLDWAGLIAREKHLIEGVPDSVAHAMARRDVEVVAGHARFVSPDSVRVGESIIVGKHIVIATGSKPRPLPFPGAEFVITSDDILSDPQLPKSVAFVGGGVISLELGQVYVRAGVDVTILELLPQLLPSMDEGAVAVLRGECERIGIKVKTGVEIKRIVREDGHLSVVFREDGQDRSIAVERVANGAGRVANTQSLDLDVGNIEHDNGRIAVDRYLRSVSNPRVFVCGDAVAGSPQLSPIATYEGNIVGRNIVEGPLHSPDYTKLATAVYTVPALASIGLTEAAARRQFAAVDVHVNDMREWFSAKSYAETVAWSKIIVDRATDQIVGAHFVGHRGEELVNIFCLAISFGITATQVRNCMFAYPTFAADIKHMLARV